MVKIYGVIGDADDGLDAKTIINKLLNSCGKTTLQIDSPGGDVFEGLAICDFIRNTPSSITSVVDGLAGGMASCVAVTSDIVKMKSDALLMVQNPYMKIVGDGDKHEKQIKLLEELKQKMINIYWCQSYRVSKQRISEMMDAETWLNADEALDLGFIDEIIK